MVQRHHMRQQQMYALNERTSRVQALVQEARALLTPPLEKLQAEIIRATQLKNIPIAANNNSHSAGAITSFADSLMDEGQQLARAVAQPLNYITRQRVTMDDDILPSAINIMADRVIGMTIRQDVTFRQRGTSAYTTLWATAQRSPELMEALVELESAGAAAAKILRKSELASTPQPGGTPKRSGR